MRGWRSIATGLVIALGTLTAAKLRQFQLETVRATRPPKSLPKGLTWPFVEADGKWVRKEK